MGGSIAVVMHASEVFLSGEGCVVNVERFKMECKVSYGTSSK
jgi:hypothetical protein